MPKQPVQKKSPLRIIAIIAIVLVCLILLIAGILWLSASMAIRKIRNDYTSDQPMVIEHEQLTSTQRTKIIKKYKSIYDVIKNGKKTTIVLDSKEFSQIMANSPETKDLAKSSKFWLEGDRMKAELAIPMNFIPQLQGRYLNGVFTFRFSITDGKLDVYVEECLVHGSPIAPAFLKMINAQDLKGHLNRQMGTSWQNSIESLEIQDSKATIKTK